MAATLQKRVVAGPVAVDRIDVEGLLNRLSLCFWFSLCLVLFLILGPFSAPIVLIALFKEGALRFNEMDEPRSLTVDR